MCIRDSDENVHRIARRHILRLGDSGNGSVGFRHGTASKLLTLLCQGEGAAKRRVGKCKSEPPYFPTCRAARGGLPLAGEAVPMVNRALTSGLLCYAGAAAGGPAVMMYCMTGDTPPPHIGAKASRATGSRSPLSLIHI